MNPTAQLRNNFSVLATTPCRGSSLSRYGPMRTRTFATLLFLDADWGLIDTKFSGLRFADPLGYVLDVATKFSVLPGLSSR